MSPKNNNLRQKKEKKRKRKKFVVEIELYQIQPGENCSANVILIGWTIKHLFGLIVPQTSQFAHPTNL